MEFFGEKILHELLIFTIAFLIPNFYGICITTFIYRERGKNLLLVMRKKYKDGKRRTVVGGCSGGRPS